MKHALLGVAALLSAVALHVSPAACGEIIEPGLPRPNQVRFEGYVGTKPDGVSLEATWSVDCLGKTYPFYVTRIFVMTGDISAMQIANAVVPYRVTFYLRGDKQTLQQFAIASAGQRVSVIAYYRSGSRQLLVAGVERQE